MDATKRPDIQTPATTRRAILAASIGNLVEWFDFAIYGYLAATLGAVFFPSEDRVASLLASFAVFGVAFAMRPLGGFFFGPLGDRIGRQRTLAVVIILMSGATFVVGLLPSYTTIGVLAPILLVLARCLQGFSAGGELGGSAAFMAEYSPNGRRGLMTSWLECSVMVAYILSIGLIFVLTSTLSEQAMTQWGWRIPFLIAGPLGVVGFYIRTRLDDTPAFRDLETSGEVAKAPFRETMTQHWRPMLRLAGITFVQWIGTYVVLIYIQTYLTEELEFSASTASLSTLLALVTAGILIPPLGALSDRVGRKPVLLASCIGCGVLAFPLFLLMTSGGTVGVILGHVALAALVAVFLSTTIAALTELFATRVRYGGFSISYAVTGVVIGGTTPFLSTYLIAATGNPMVPAFFLIVAAAVSFGAVVTSKETAHSPLQQR